MTIFNANQIKFDKDYLNELVNEPCSGVIKHQCKYHVALHPAQLNDFGQSIKDELGRNIARYDESFKGIMLGYEDITLESKLGVIGPDNCYIHIDIQAQFFVFRPEIGMELKGKVTRTTKDHVGCLVYNTFNISLPKPEDDEEAETWLGKNVTVNSEVEFKISYVDLNARLPHIRGQLRAILCKAEPIDISQNRDGNNELEKKGKKIRFDSFDDDEEPQEKPKKKHKKKDKDTLEEHEVTDKSKKSKKHKKKRNKSEDLDVSLESLDLKSLFADSSMDFASENQVIAADSSDRKVKRKRSKSLPQETYLPEVKLEVNSDLENIIG